MRWDQLFSDLESRFERDLDDAAAAEGLDEDRARIASRTLRERLLEHADASVVLRASGGATMRMELHVVGADWAAGRLAAGGSVLLPLAAIDWARLEPAPDPRSSRAPDDRQRIALPVVLRELARRRTVVDVALAQDRPSGTIDRVGADHLDLAVHPRDVPRRETAVAATWIVPLAAILHVRWAE